MTTHRMGEGWSERNRIPTVQEYLSKERIRNGEQPNSSLGTLWNWATASDNPSQRPSSPDSLQRSNTDLSYLQSTVRTQGSTDEDSHRTSSTTERPDEASQHVVPSSTRDDQTVMHQDDTPSDEDTFMDSQQDVDDAEDASMKPYVHLSPHKQQPKQQSHAVDGLKQTDQNSREKQRHQRSFSLLRRRSSRRSRSQRSGSDEADTASFVSKSSEKIPEHQEVLDSGGGEEEKNRIKEAAKASREPKKNNFIAKGRRIVEDPVTGERVIIQDGRDFKIDPKELDSRYKGGFSARRPLSCKSYDTKYTSPDPARPTSILLQSFPEPLDPGKVKELDDIFLKLYLGYGALIVLVWGIATIGHGWGAFATRTFWLGLAGIAGFMGLGTLRNVIMHQMERMRVAMHRQRGEKYSPPYPESVEWMNAIIACVWRQLNPEMFVPIIDQVEDIMQASLPSMISAVKVSDVSLGSNPFRVISMRGLAELMTEKTQVNKAWIERNNELLGSGKSQHDNDNNCDSDEGNQEDEFHGLEAMDPELRKEAVEDKAGDFLNLEVSFCYSALPGESSKDRTKNVHLLIEFFIGAFDWLEIPLPVWVQIERIIGTARIRAQIMSEPPFVRNVTFSLMGVPNIAISAIPISRILPNVLDLPIISHFVQTSIAAASDMYVAPKSMTLNVQRILNGDGVKKDTEAVGVIVVNIHYGQNLSSQDLNGRSDPYCVLSLAKFGRPMYSTRIIFEDLDPVWEETAFLLVSKEDIRSDEGLSLQLWDSDKRSADDIVGRVNVPLRHLMRHPNQIKSHLSNLMGFEDADQMQGQLSWSVGFFEKAKLNKKLRKTEDESNEDEVDKVVKRKPSPIDSEQEALALDTPPDEEYPSGILSVIVKFIAGLERRDVEKGVDDKDREGAAGQDVEMSSAKLPCGYCELILNDNLFYKTRVKQYNNMPFYQAGTEVFVRDWTTSELRMIVRDSRVREHDPIMGIVALPLKDLFREASQIEQSFALQDGVGYGKLHCSIVFRSVKLKMPRELRGFNTVSVDLLSSIEVKGNTPEWMKKLDDVKITLVANKFEKKLGTRYKNHVPDNEPLARVPVFDRYSTNLVFCFGRTPLTSTLPIPNFFRAVGVAILPLRELEDDQITDVELPILAGPALHALERNFVNKQTKETHKFNEVGTLAVRVCVNPGMDEAHKPMLVGSRDRHEFEVYERLVSLPNRAEVNSHANDDGIITRQERKEMNRLQTRELHMRHRGAMGYTPIRTAVWAKDGLKSHMSSLGRHMFGSKDQRDQYVKSEV